MRVTCRTSEDELRRETRPQPDRSPRVAPGRRNPIRVWNGILTVTGFIDDGASEEEGAPDSGDRNRTRQRSSMKLALTGAGQR